MCGWIVYMYMVYADGCVVWRWMEKLGEKIFRYIEINRRD